MVEDKELDEATKRILEKTASINLTRADVKPSQNGKRKKRGDISNPTERNDKKDKIFKEIENLEAQDAILKIEQEIEKDFDNVHLWIKLGEKLSEADDKDRAIHALRTALMKKPKDKTALKHLALTYEDLKKWKDAIECWAQILNQDEEDELALREYAWCSLKITDYEQAILYYTKVLTINPRDVDSNDNLGYVFHATKKYDDAIKQLEKSLNLERKSGDSFAERYLAFSHHDLGDDKKVWEHYLDEALSKKTEDWEVPFFKGELAYNDGDFGDAIMWFKQSVKLQPRNENLFELGRCYASERKFELAVFYYNKSESLSKGNLYSLMNMAGCHIDLKNYEISLELSNKVLDLNKTVVRALYLKNICYKELNQTEKIIESVKNFEKINGQSFFHKGSPLELEEDKQWQTNVIHQLVRAYDKLEKFDKSLECVNVLLELENIPEYQDLKAWTLEGAGKIKEALEICEELIMNKTDLSYVYSRKGDLLYENYPERLDEALEAKQKCLEILKEKENSQGKLVSNYVDMAKIMKEIGNLIDKKDRHVNAKNGEYKSKMEKALEFAELAIENDDGSWEAWYEKGNCYWNLQKDDSALECYEKAVLINPKNVNIWMCLGDTTKRLGSVSEAKYFYEKAIQVSNKKVEDETKLRSNNTTKNYDWFDAELEFTRCLWDEGKPSEALDEIKKIFETGRKRHIDVHRIRALAYGRLEKWEDAINAWEIGMKDFSEDKWFKGVCLYNASADADNAGWNDVADSYAQKLIDSDAEISTDGYQLQGRYLRRDKEYEKAIIMLEEHLANFSKHGKKQALEILISCCDQIGDKEKKEEYERRIKELEKD